LGCGSQHAVKENEHHADAVLVGDVEELVHPLQETLRVLLPEHVVQEHADAREAQSFRQCELAIDLLQVERSGCHISSWLIACWG
jgi:hypothetical protein